MATLAFRYGLLDPIDWDEDCREQLFLMNRLWNTLVEIEHKHRTKYREIVGADDAVAELQGQIDALFAEKGRLREERNALRKKARARVATLEIDARLKAISAEVKPLLGQCRAARGAAKEQVRPAIYALNLRRAAEAATARQKYNWGMSWDENEVLTSRLIALNDERGRIGAAAKDRAKSRGEKKVTFSPDEQRRRTQIRGAIAQLKKSCSPKNAPLWWGNANAVGASYEAAREKAMKEGAELRFRRFTGEGRFTVQIIGGASVKEILSGAKQVAIDLSERAPVDGRHFGKARPRSTGGGMLGVLSMTIYTHKREARFVNWPLVYDQPLPDAARIQQVTVTHRRIGTHWRDAVIFTCRMPDAPPIKATSQRVCGINLGFRQTPEGLRIATIYSETGIERAHLSADWMAAMDRDVETIRQQRDLALDELHTKLRAQWPDRPEGIPEAIAERLGNLVKAPKFAAASLAAVILRWREHVEKLIGERLDVMARENRVPSEYTLLQQLHGWRRLDKKWGLECEAHKRERLGLARREQYRLLARDLSSRFGLIRIAALDLSQMAELERTDGRENELHQRARRNRARASLYLLQQEIQQQASKTGAFVEYVGGAVTRTCNACGGSCSVGVDLIHVCEHCSAVWDQDDNAARNTFAAAREHSDGEPEPGEHSHQSAQTVTRSERMRRGRERRSAVRRSQSAGQTLDSLGISEVAD